MARRVVCAVVLLLSLGTAEAAAPSQSAPRFAASEHVLSPALRKRMTGVSWHEGCPVSLDDLRLVKLRYYDFDGRVRTGQLVVNRAVTPAIKSVFRQLFEAKFRIRRMLPIDNYGGSDFRSIEADNTSAFNCRNVAGSSRWSQHAYGLAIDVNPIENPYVYANGTSSHKASGPYLNRSYRPGMAVEGSPLVAAFDSVHWGWGGRWSGEKDYQHFSSSGT